MTDIDIELLLSAIDEGSRWSGQGSGKVSPSADDDGGEFSAPAIAHIKDALLSVLHRSRMADHSLDRLKMRDLIEAIVYHSDWHQIDYFQAGFARSVIGVLVECAASNPEFQPIACEIVINIVAQVCLNRREDDICTTLVPAVGFLLDALLVIVKSADNYSAMGTQVLACGKKTIYDLCASQIERPANWALCVGIIFIAMKLIWLGVYDPPTNSFSASKDAGVSLDASESDELASRTRVLFEALSIILQFINSLANKIDISSILTSPEALRVSASTAAPTTSSPRNGRAEVVEDWFRGQLRLLFDRCSSQEASVGPSQRTLSAFDAFVAYVTMWAFDFNSSYVTIRQEFDRQRIDKAADKFKNKLLDCLNVLLACDGVYTLSLLLPVGLCLKHVSVPVTQRRVDYDYSNATYRLSMDVHFTPSAILISANATSATMNRGADALRSLVAQFQSLLHVDDSFPFASYSSGTTCAVKPDPLRCHTSSGMSNVEVFVRLSCTLCSILSHMDRSEACDGLFVDYLCNLSDFLIYQHEILLESSPAVMQCIDLIAPLTALWVHFSYGLIHFLAGQTSETHNPLTDPCEDMQRLLANLHVIFDLIYPPEESYCAIFGGDGGMDSLLEQSVSRWIPLCALPPSILWYLNSYVFPLVQPVDPDRVVGALDYHHLLSSEIDEKLNVSERNKAQSGEVAAWYELKAIRAWLSHHQFSIMDNIASLEALRRIGGAAIPTSLGLQLFRGGGVLPNIHEWSLNVVVALETSFRAAAEATVDQDEYEDDQFEDQSSSSRNVRESLHVGISDEVAKAPRGPRSQMTSACAKCIFSRDIMTHVASFLNAKRVNMLAQCNKHLYMLCRDRFLWQKRFFERRRKQGASMLPLFADEVITSPSISDAGAAILPAAHVLVMPSMRAPSLCRSCYRNRSVPRKTALVPSNDVPVVAMGRGVVTPATTADAASSSSVATGKPAPGFMIDSQTTAFSSAGSSSSAVGSAPAADSRFGAHLHYLRGSGSSASGCGGNLSAGARRGYSIVARRSGCCKSRSDLHDWFALYWREVALYRRRHKQYAACPVVGCEIGIKANSLQRHLARHLSHRTTENTEANSQETLS